MKDWKYLMYLGILVGLLLLVVLSGEKKYDWTVTLAHEDKNPYGAYALNELLSPLKKVEHSYKTFYELKDSLTSKTGVLILAERFGPSKEETEAMLAYAKDGGVVFISANSISGKLADTLQIQTDDHFIQSSYLQDSESASIHLRNASMDTVSRFYFKKENVYSNFTTEDTIKARQFHALLVASNHNNQPVGLRLAIGKGSIVLCSTPLIFTNYCLLKDDNHTLASSLLSYIPQSRIYWTEYYQLGRMEVASPLRYILSSEPLRWAYYLAMVAVIFFILFEAKRKQRIIPIIKPLANTTVDFVSTIGGLYYENADHKGIAMKKIHSFQEALRSKFYLNQSIFAPNFVQTLSLKSGVGEEKVQRLTDIIRSITAARTISEEDLKTLHQRIQDFWNK
jgi:hypothetical protein